MLLVKSKLIHPPCKEIVIYIVCLRNSVWQAERSVSYLLAVFTYLVGNSNQIKRRYMFLVRTSFTFNVLHLLQLCVYHWKLNQVINAQIFTVSIWVDHMLVLAANCAQANFCDFSAKPARTEELLKLIPDFPDRSMFMAAIGLSPRFFLFVMCFIFRFLSAFLDWNAML